MMTGDSRAQGAPPLSGFNQTSAEMGHLYYTELGLSAGIIHSTATLNNTVFNVHGDSFDNLVASDYFSGTEYSNPSSAWGFSLDDGDQSAFGKGDFKYALAVHSGRVVTAGPVPEPATMLLLGTGLAGLIGARRKKKA